jgi:hypothetical protein
MSRAAIVGQMVRLVEKNSIVPGAKRFGLEQE